MISRLAGRDPRCQTLRGGGGGEKGGQLAAWRAANSMGWGSRAAPCMQRGASTRVTARKPPAPGLSPCPVPRQMRRKPSHRTVTTAWLHAAAGARPCAWPAELCRGPCPAAFPAAAGGNAGRPPLTCTSVKSMHLQVKAAAVPRGRALPILTAHAPRQAPCHVPAAALPTPHHPHHPAPHLV